MSASSKLQRHQEIIDRIGAVFVSEYERETAERIAHLLPYPIRVFPTINATRAAYERAYARAERQIRMERRLARL